MHHKAKLFKEQSYLSSFLLTYGKDKGPKWQLSTQQANSMSKMHETCLPSTPGEFEPVLLP